MANQPAIQTVPGQGAAAINQAIPSSRTYLVQLPLCTLHVMESGSGPPLIIVPATVSELENWADLVRFTAQWFRAYFFELPGHGQSSPLPATFTSDQVAATVSQLVDHIGAERFSLMGFSFGGILAMKTFHLLRTKIDRMIFISPCVTKEALLLTRVQRLAAIQLNSLLKRPPIRDFLYRVAQKKRYARMLASFMHTLGKVENVHHLEHKLATMRPSLIEIVSRELDEILGIEFSTPDSRYDIPCHVAMSVHDPLLDFGTTVRELGRHFSDMHVTELPFRFHQPPRPFTFDELNQLFRPTAAGFLTE